MIPEILKLPEVPRAIKEAVNSGKLAVFIGAGVSRLMGCRAWGELAQDLLDRCAKEGIMNFREKESLSKMGDHRKVITICHHRLEAMDLGPLFLEVMRSALKKNESETHNIYDDVIKLRGVFVTTNADSLFDEKFVPSRIFWDPADLAASNVRTNALYHIHGHIDHPHSLVFTTRQYLERYRRGPLTDLLHHIFANYTVLFLGYGLAEFEILEHMLGGRIPEAKAFPRFLVDAFYSSDTSLCAYEQDYYRDFGVELVPYEKDAVGYRQLIAVLEKWNLEINHTTVYLDRATRKIDDAFISSEESIQEILQFIRNDDPLRDYFFQRFAKTPEPLKWFRPLVDTGYFEPAQNPAPQESPDRPGYFHIPHWFAAEALENVVTRALAEGNAEILSLAKEKIDNLVASDLGDGQGGIRNSRTSWLLLKSIGRFPPALIDSTYLKFVARVLDSRWGWGFIDAEIGDSFLPAVLSGANRELVVELLRIIFRFHKPAAGSFREIRPVMEQYAFVQCLEKNRVAVAQRIPEEASLMGLELVREVLAADRFAFSFSWVPTVEIHPQTISPDRYECQLTYFLRDMFLSVPVQFALRELEALLNSETEILRRIAFFVVGERFDELGVLFWQSATNPFEETYYHEVFELVRKNCHRFDAGQVARCLGWVEGLIFSFRDDPEITQEIRQKYEAYSKREWLIALEGADSSEVKICMEKYLAINDAPIPHPGFPSWQGSSGWVSEVSPISEVEFKAFSADEAVNYLNGFEPPPMTFSEGFTQVSLTGPFRRFVTGDPQHFLSNLAPYLDLAWKYQVELMRGFEEVARGDTFRGWPVLIEYLQKLVKKIGCSANGQPISPGDVRKWIVDSVADLLTAGSCKEGAVIPVLCFPACEELLSALMSLPAEPVEPSQDVLTAVLNSQRGRVFRCAVTFSLAIARLGKGPPGENWSAAIKAEFSRRLDHPQGPETELVAVLAMHIPNLLYLDRTWVQGRFHQILDLQDSASWTVAFSTLLLSTGTVYQEVYDLVLKGGHFDRALETELVGRDVNQKFVQVLTIGFLAGWDLLSSQEGALRRLIERGNSDDLTEIGRFIWAHPSLPPEAFRTQILPLWRTMIERISRENNPNDYSSVFSELGNWLKWADELDEEVFHLMQVSIDGMDSGRIPPFFVENLRDWVDRRPAEVGRLFFAFLEPRPVPFYKDDVVLSIVEGLLIAGLDELAMRIHTYYLRSGFQFLKPLFEKFGQDGQASPN